MKDADSTEFPVVDSKQDMRLIGIIYKKQLTDLAARVKENGSADVDVVGLADQSGLRQRHVEGEERASESSSSVSPLVDLSAIVAAVPISLHESTRNFLGIETRSNGTFCSDV